MPKINAVLDKIIVVILAIAIMTSGVSYFYIMQEYDIPLKLALFLLTIPVYLLLMFFWGINEVKKYSPTKLVIGILIMLSFIPVVLSLLFVANNTIKLSDNVSVYVISGVLASITIIFIFEQIISLLIKKGLIKQKNNKSV